ncbi:MAG: methyltransferase domain-containing protein [Candidatus Bathyarchaeota archaeon]
MPAKHVNKISENPCPICGSKHSQVFFEMLDVPIHCNILWPRRDAAQNCPKGDINLAFCPVCSFITNLKFEQDRLEYTKAYENPLHFSPHFRVYARSLAEQLIERYNLYNKDIIEIGCGDGYFLKLLCELGNNRGVGFDPAYSEKEKHCEKRNQVKFIQDIYSEHYSNYQTDLIVCRQTLEHIQNPKSFLTELRQAIGNRLNSYTFFEVPNALNIFQKLSVWDIIYEHCSYFTPVSLSFLFASNGFQVCDLTEEFGDQFLCIHARPSDQVNPDSDYEYSSKANQIASYITSFATNYQNKIEMYRRKLENIKSRGQCAVVWGAGSKGATFLNTLKNLQIEYVVDINPHKQGMYIPGTGQRIVPPDFLRDYQPDIIIVMNPIYKTEIRQLAKNLDLTNRFVYA